ncbi:hypothetical protein JCM10213_005090 [Rhodosporidiobolus nylandii]
MSCTSIDLLADLARLDELYLAFLASGEAQHLDAYSTYVFSRAKEALSAGTLPPAALTALRATATRIRVVSAGIQELEAERRKIETAALVRVRCVCEDGGAVTTTSSPFSPSSPSSTPPDDPNDPAHLIPCREWFRDHLAHPYPSSVDKAALLDAVPTLNKQQLDTWFTNNRRRSGWQALKRAHTDGTPEDFVALLERVEDGLEPEEVARKVRKVRAFFEDGGRDRVDERIQAIVRSGVPKSATRRRIEQRATRGVGSLSSSASSSSHANLPYARPSTPPPRFSPPSELVASPDEFGAYPRYPSTFSSSSSRRTVSDSSTSSSLLSYASASSLVPASPPASSSLLSFDGRRASSSSTTSSAASFPIPSHVRPVRRRARPPPPPPPQEPHPYFCTLAELPGAASTLASFAAFTSNSQGDLLVE